MNGYKKNYHLEKKFHEFENLRKLLEHSAKKYGDKTAFVTKIKDRKNKSVSYIDTTYRQLYKDMVGLGNSLLDLGLADEKIALIGENSYRWCQCYFTVASGVGVIVPLDKMLQKEELASCLVRSGATTVFCDKKHCDIVESIRNEGLAEIKQIIGLDFTSADGLNIVELSENITDQMLDDGCKYLSREIDGNAMSFLLFTSGTTEQSKAVMLSHKNLMSCNYGMNLEEVFFEDDVNMMILPLHHCYGMSGLLTFLSQGLKNVFCDGLKYIQANMKEYQVTVIMSVPLLLENMYKKIQKAIAKDKLEKKIATAMKIADAGDKIGINLRKKLFAPINDQFGGKLRFIINGAAALDPKVSEGFNKLGILTVQGYGLTETSPTIASETYRYLKPGSVGKVMPNVEAKLIDVNEEGIGQLVVKGDNVMLGYYDDPLNTAKVLKDGWFYTGDLAYMDQEGFLFITGRAKNVIVMKNGKNVYPEEIETIINELPYVDESMVFATDRQTDLLICAKVVVNEAYMKEQGMSLDDMKSKLDEDMEQINNALPQYKMVKKYFASITPTIKTTTQKTKRKEEMKAIEEEMAQLGI